MKRSVEMATINRPGLVGTSVKRVNDPRLLTGTGRFVDDISLPNMVHATILRSTIPHGTLTRFDANDSGALLVLGPDEIGNATSPMPCMWIAPNQPLLSYPIAERQLRYVGQPFGIVVAVSRAEAEDAAETLDIDIEELPSVGDAVAALLPGAPVLYPELGSNLVVEFSTGDSREHVEDAMAKAPIVISRRLRIPRIVPSPMETRGVVAEWNAGTRQLSVWLSTQVEG